MKNAINHLFIVCIALLLSVNNTVFAQTGNKECKQLLRNAYKKINVAEKNNATTYIHYTTKISAWNKEEFSDSETEVKLLTAGKQVHFLTKEASFYSDEKDIFLLITRTQDLVHSKPMMTNENENLFVQQASLIQDSLLITSTVSLCQDITLKDGSVLRKIELVPPLQTKKIHKIEKVMFLIDKSSGLIKRLQITYTKQSEIKQIDNYYHIVDNNYNAKLTTPVYELFFDKHHKLLPKYKDFNYIDNTL